MVIRKMKQEKTSSTDQMRLGSTEFMFMNNRFRRYYQEHYEFRYFLSMLDSQHVNLDGTRIMDAGCGSGYSSFLISNKFHPQYLTAFDLMPEQIELAKLHYPEIDFRVGNLLAIPEKDESYDAAFVFGVIHHIPEWISALQESRCLKPEGYLLIEEPWKRFKFRELELEIENIGFTILKRKIFRWGFFRTYLAQKTSEER